MHSVVDIFSGCNVQLKASEVCCVFTALKKATNSETRNSEGRISEDKQGVSTAMAANIDSVTFLKIMHTFFQKSVRFRLTLTVYINTIISLTHLY